MGEATEGEMAAAGARERTLPICCGAVAREIASSVRANHWEGVRVQCLPPEWHNHPERVPKGVRAKIVENRARFERIVVPCSDCGTGGRLQRVLDEEGVEGIGGPHCYEVFAGAGFPELMHEEPGTYFLTGFLVRHSSGWSSRALASTSILRFALSASASTGAWSTWRRARTRSCAHGPRPRRAASVSRSRSGRRASVATTRSCARGSAALRPERSADQAPGRWRTSRAGDSESAAPETRRDVTSRDPT